MRDLELVTQWAQRNAALDGQAYTVSAEAVRLFEESVSRAGLVRMLEATSRGTSFADAFAIETGQSVADFERAFPARLAAEHGTARIAQTALADGVRWTLAGLHATERGHHQDRGRRLPARIRGHDRQVRDVPGRLRRDRPAGRVHDPREPVRGHRQRSDPDVALAPQASPF